MHCIIDTYIVGGSQITVELFETLQQIHIVISSSMVGRCIANLTGYDERDLGIIRVNK